MCPVLCSGRSLFCSQLLLNNRFFFVSGNDPVAFTHTEKLIGKYLHLVLQHELVPLSETFKYISQTVRVFSQISTNPVSKIISAKAEKCQ